MPTVPTRKRPAPHPIHPDVEADDGGELLPEPVEFTVEFDREGEPETHTFLARPKLTYKRMTDAARGVKSKGLAAVTLFEKLIRPALLDDDGVPAKWRPEVDGGTFIDPDGETRELADLPKLLELEAGSSRRRWLYLMDDDDELEVDLQEIADAYELLIGKATDRPTRRSSR